MKTSKNRFHFAPNFGFFLGPLENNQPHKHYAIQMSFAIDSELKAVIDNETITSKSLFLKSNQLHQLNCSNDHLTILVNPLSKLGHYICEKQKEVNGQHVSEDISQPIHQLLKNVGNKRTNEIFHEIATLLSEFECRCDDASHTHDDRILKALTFLDSNADRVVSQTEIAAVCHLSESRFLHLFKEKTQLSFRRYQLWIKLVSSLPYLSKHSISETAHLAGFSDSSHYARTFKETFGFTPKFVLSHI